ncbi:MAG: hypothetical protein EA401_09030 [Planctomycetota bacterium]|nr:MAG: hypothetical protein EA401_09030 [Planctomycetota bacterium]
MDVEIQEQAPWTIITAGPTAGACDSEEWLSLFEDLFERGVRHTIIDCHLIAVPTSPLLSALVLSNSIMERGHGCSWIVGCNDRMQRAITITGLADAIHQADTIDDVKRIGCPQGGT